MTTQTLMTETPASTTVAPVLIDLAEVTKLPIDPHQSRLLEAMKSQYRLDQQEKFLHLQAEAEVLLQQLKALKQERLAAANVSH